MEWISVKDRLPKQNNAPCIVWNGANMVAATYDKKEKAFFLDDLYEDCKLETVTRWMPFPEPPKE